MSWLYRYETKGIQQWILDSNKLRDLAGGSSLIEHLTEQAKDRACKTGATDVLQATSGSMTAVFPHRDGLEEFASSWPLYVALTAPGLQIVHAWVEADRGGTNELFRRLAQRKNMAYISDIQAGPWVLRAGRSGLPAIPKPADILTSARHTTLDATALAKERAYAIRTRSPNPSVTGGYVWETFLEDLDRWPEGAVAVVHADGSGVGQRLMELGDDGARLREFSRQLQVATTEATRAAIGEEMKLAGNDSQICARPVVSAGDDLTFIVPASRGRAFAVNWLRALESNTEREFGVDRSLSGGAGIAIVHKNFPFSQAYEMAEQLCSAAKKAVNRGVSVMAFRRVTTSLLEDVCSNATAWSAEDQDQLDALLGAVRQLPRGTLRTWLKYVDAGEKEQAAQTWQRAREVADATIWKRFKTALEQVGADPNTGLFVDGPRMAMPLRSDPHSATPVRDALTLTHIEKVGN